jgi:hypothetical protein
MKNTISDTRFVNTLPIEVVEMIEENPSKWAYAMNKNRVLRKELKYRGESMKPSTFAELTLTDFGCLIDGSMKLPRDFDYITTTFNDTRPLAARYSGSIWPPHADRQTTSMRPGA